MMSSSPNGRRESHPDPTRRLRYDDLASVMARTYPRGSGELAGDETAARSTVSPWLPRTHSGRRFVIVAGLVVLLIWGVLYLVFREWRARYRERAAYGITQVVPAIDPLFDIVPPAMDPGEWREAVSRTHDMLVTVTASNLLGIGEMKSLRDELDQTVGRSRARPETAAAELAGVWDAMADRAEFLLRDSRSRTGDRHPRPKSIPSYGQTRVVPAVDPLVDVIPPGIDRVSWRDAIERTRALLLKLTDTDSLSITQLKTLRTELDRAVARARAHPETSVAELARLWDSAKHLDPSRFEGGQSSDIDPFPRPEILPPRSETLKGP
ncbi:MAG: hypothetical protein ACLQGP_22790 [Isosphaeraceae bacterium]